MKHEKTVWTFESEFCSKAEHLDNIKAFLKVFDNDDEWNYKLFEINKQSFSCWFLEKQETGGKYWNGFDWIKIDMRKKKVLFGFYGE